MNNLLSRINKSLIEYYSHTATSATPAQQVGWKDETAQRRRFDQLLKIITAHSHFTLNDFGCGLGDLSEYMTQQGFTEFEYKGYDMFESMINKAKSHYGAAANRQFLTLEHPDQMKRADFTVASGVLNIRFDIPDSAWLDYIKDMISVFDAKSAKGFAFNALTIYSDKEYMKKELYYTDPCHIFDYCKKNFSKNVALLHDYTEYDFTILVRK